MVLPLLNSHQKINFMNGRFIYLLDKFYFGVMDLSIQNEWIRFIENAGKTLDFNLRHFESHHPYFLFRKVTDIYNPINQRSICDIETLKKRIHDQSVQFSNRYACKLGSRR